MGAETQVAASFMRHLLHSQPSADPMLGRRQRHFCVDGIEEHIPLRQDEPGRHQAGEGRSPPKRPLCETLSPRPTATTASHHGRCPQTILLWMSG